MKYDNQKDFEYVKSIITFERDRIHQIHGVVGTGISHSNITGIGDGYHLVVYLESENSSIINQLPSKIYDIPVAYRVKGISRIASSSEPIFTSRYRPIKGGASVSLKYYEVGTIAGFPQTDDGKYVILSNNHVIAHDDPWIHVAQIGKEITQPGNTDFGGENDIVGKLAKWVTIIPKTLSPFEVNKVDCAYATINPDISIDMINLCGFRIKYTIPPYIGMPIKKAGRTTGCTFGTITELDVRLNVNYSYDPTNPKWATFTGQIQTSPNFCSYGDSGAAIVKSDTENVVGLIFSTDDTDGSATCNVMSDVETTLGISFGKGPIPEKTVSGFDMVLGSLAIGYARLLYKNLYKKSGKK